MKVGDRVTHRDRPGEVGTVNRIIYLTREYGTRTALPWYRVTWPSGIGTNALYIESELTVV